MTKKEAFAKAEEEYRQARANTYALYKELVHLKSVYGQAQIDEERAMRAYYSFVKPTTKALEYEKYLDEVGLK